MENYLYTKSNGEYIFKINDKATMKNSKIFSDFLNEIIKDATGISFEMSNLTYMDSTFLGIVAKYAIELKTKKNKVLNILNPSNEAKLLLKQTGILKFVEIINLDQISSYNKIDGKDFDDKDAKSKYILEMHEVLLNLNEENKEVFTPVVEEMRKAVKK